ncbi:MAG: DUF2779 domain-containing protein [Elusimicrobia bacterium]|nr:DUF2779 domain-containing protein [Elusimicrobiota bacterium]
MTRITKKIFLTYTECPKLAWLTKRNLLSFEVDAASRLLQMESANIHRMGRETFGQGANAYDKDINTAYQNTQNFILKKTPLIFKAAFVSEDNFSTRIDVLRYQPQTAGLPEGWHLIEVKTANKKKAKYIEDLAYSAMVIKRCGINLLSVSLMHLNKDYRKGEDFKNLFETHDVTESVFEKVANFEKMSSHIVSVVGAQEEPFATLKMKCKNCDVFKTCVGAGIENHIFDLPRIGIQTFCDLRDIGAEKIEDVPENFELNELQQTVRNCVIENKNYTSENLKDELEKIVYPVYYLDFESIATALPLYDNIPPHGQIITQFSVHKQTAPQAPLEHFEYIADETKNCAEIIARKLIEIFEETGTITAYSNSEKVLILRLAKDFPEMSEQLKAIAERIIDLEIILRKNYYNLNFHGRTSIKKILPVIAPEVNYESLEIGEGAAAGAEFAFIAMGLYDAEKTTITKKHLLEYCAQDTLALAKIHGFLLKASQNL